MDEVQDLRARPGERRLCNYRAFVQGEGGEDPTLGTQEGIGSICREDLSRGDPAKKTRKEQEKEFFARKRKKRKAFFFQKRICFPPKNA